MSKPSLRKAIDAHCKSCGYDAKSGLGAWRQQIEACPITSCELYAVRPISGGKYAYSTEGLPESLRKYREGITTTK